MTNLSIICLALFLISCSSSQTQAQTNRCTTACANDVSCNTNQCILTSCLDTVPCYQYCLQCSGIVTCYGIGPSCPITMTQNQNQTSSTTIPPIPIQKSSSNQLKYSLLFLNFSSAIIIWVTK